MSFAHKTALITGGASGIGLETARLLTRLGAQTILLDINAAAGERAAAELGVPFLPLDVADPIAWQQVCAHIGDQYGSLDIAVLNAGVRGPERLIQNLTPDALAHTVGVNVFGVVYGIRYCLDLLQPHGGSIVATASIAGLRGTGTDPVYSMTKHAVIGLMRSLAPQLADKNISINAVCPTVTDTPLVRANEDFMAALAAQAVPMLGAADIAHAVVSILLSGGTGQAVVCRVGHVPHPWAFPAPDEAMGEVLPRPERAAP